MFDISLYISSLCGSRGQHENIRRLRVFCYIHMNSTLSISIDMSSLIMIICFYSLIRKNKTVYCRQVASEVGGGGAAYILEDIYTVNPFNLSCSVFLFIMTVSFLERCALFYYDKCMHHVHSYVQNGNLEAMASVKLPRRH